MQEIIHTSKSVTETNARFYEEIASVYDQIDSRRGVEFQESAWLKELLQDFFERLSVTQSSPAFLDVGAGSGFLSLHAKRFFSNITLVDISPAMLDRIPLPEAKKVCASCTEMPFAENAFDLVGAFATLHHLFSPLELFQEAYRVLKPGGIFYSDHDIEQNFVKRFAIPLKCYRYFFDHGKKYLKASRRLTQGDYLTTEYHGDSGLSAMDLAEQLESVGFEKVEVCYHWQGMGFPQKIVSLAGLEKPLSKKGTGPVFRLVGRKPLN